MSLAIKHSRAGALPSMYGYGMGDPGLGSFFGGILRGVGKIVGAGVKGFVGGGPLGAITGAAGALGIRDARRSVTSTALVPLAPSGAPLTIPSMPMPTAYPRFPIHPAGPAPFSGPGGGNTTQSGVSGPLLGTPTAAPCQPGFHKNKHGYYTKRYGYIERGTVCVRNRKRNPLNPRALSHSMKRLASATKAVRKLHIMPKPTHRSGTTVVRRKPCGCK